MADTRIGGSPESRAPVSTETNETESVAATQSTDSSSAGIDENRQETARTADAFKRGAGESMGQNNLRGSLLRQGLDQLLTPGPSRQGAPNVLSYSSTHPAQTAGTQQSKTSGSQGIGGTTLAQRNQEHATRGLQTQLNRWREATGQPPISVNGKNDKKTEDAIRDFQNKSGLPADGIAGPSTRERLSLLIDIEKRTAGKPGQSANLNSILGSPAFRSMPEPMQTQMLKHIRSYANGNASSAIAHLQDIVSKRNFEILPAGNKQVLLDSYYESPTARRAELVTKASDSILFQFLSPDLQNEALRHLTSYPRNAGQFDNIVSLLNERSFQSVNPDVRDQILENMPKIFNPRQLDPNNIPNLIQLASEPDFANVRPEARLLMLQTLGQRLDNPQLAAALAQLSQNMGFRNDQRNWRSTILNVDSSIP
jgi:putative peptidoglycan binding protein